MSTSVKIDVYQIITDRIIELLEKGTAPWQKPWRSARVPMNLISKRPYKGINVLLLASLGYDQNLFLTFDQLKKLGGSVNRGEHGHIICFWKTAKKDENLEEAEEKPTSKSHSILKYYKVFNVAQCKDIPESVLPTIDVADHPPLLECDAIIKAMPNCPTIQSNEPQAYYDPELDIINMPKKRSFKTNQGYYGTLFHELIHSTGHGSRLNRKSITEMHELGGDAYSKEELVAEIGSCFLSNVSSILDSTIKNNAAYIDSWLQRLKGDKRLIVFAASQAQRAAEYILNLPEPEPADEVEQPEVLTEE